MLLKALITAGCASHIIFAHLQASTSTQLAQENTISYEAVIVSSTIWRSFDSDEQQYVFTLSDGTRWMTDDADHFRSVIEMGWDTGHHLIIRLTDEGWLAQNIEQQHQIRLAQLCNKRN